MRNEPAKVPQILQAMLGDYASRILGYIAGSLLFNVPYELFLFRLKKIANQKQHRRCLLQAVCATAVGAK